MKKLHFIYLTSLLVLITVFASCSFDAIVTQKSNKTSIVLEFPQLHTGNQRQVNRAVINKASYLYLFTVKKDTNEAKLYGPYSVSPGKTLTITDIEVAEYSFFCILNTASKENDLESKLIDEGNPSEESLMEKFASSNTINSAATAKILENKKIIAGINTISETLIPLVQDGNEKIYSATPGSLEPTHSPVFYKITNNSDNEYFSFPSPQQGSTVLLYDANGKMINTTDGETRYSQKETKKNEYIFVYYDNNAYLSYSFVEDIPNTTGRFIVRSDGSDAAFGTMKPTTIKNALTLIGASDAGPPNGFEIILLENISLDSTIEMDVNKAITIKSCPPHEGKYSITADSSLHNSLFNITKGNIIFDNIIIGSEEGDPKELEGSAVYVLPGDDDKVSLTLKNTTIQNFSNIWGDVTLRYGGGIYIEGNTSNTANLILEEGSLIRNCSAGYGGGVIVLDNSIFTMKGGSILNNTADTYGGGVYVAGILTIKGTASITGNKADTNGGGVYVETSGTLEKNGGSITGNLAQQGGGVFNNGGTITGTGTDVSGNTPN